MRAVGSAEAEAAEKVGPYKPNPEKQRGHEHCGVGRERTLGFNFIGRILTSGGATRNVGWAEAKGWDAVKAGWAVRVAKAKASSKH